MSCTQDQIQGCQLSDMIRPIDRVMIELNKLAVELSACQEKAVNK
jgi:hypothetical protein